MIARRQRQVAATFSARASAPSSPARSRSFIDLQARRDGAVGDVRNALGKVAWQGRDAVRVPTSHSQL